jgi:hypothetical protein
MIYKRYQDDFAPSLLYSLGLARETRENHKKVPKGIKWMNPRLDLPVGK